MSLPVSIQFSVRSAEGLGLPWAPGPCVASLGAAFDELAAWPAPPGPQIVRAEAREGSGDGVVGDWWTEPGQSAPRAIFTPRWGWTPNAARWASKRAAVDLWEACPNAVWMAETLGNCIPRMVLVVALRVAATLQPFVPPDDARPQRALAAIQAWRDDPDGDPTALLGSAEALAGAGLDRLDDARPAVCETLVAFEILPTIFTIPQRALLAHYTASFLNAAAGAHAAAAFPSLDSSSPARTNVERAFLAEVAGWMRETIPLAAWLRSQTVP